MRNNVSPSQGERSRRAKISLVIPAILAASPLVQSRFYDRGSASPVENASPGGETDRNIVGKRLRGATSPNHSEKSAEPRKPDARLAWLYRLQDHCALGADCSWSSTLWSPWAETGVLPLNYTLTGITGSTRFTRSISFRSSKMGNVQELDSAVATLSALTDSPLSSSGLHSWSPLSTGSKLVAKSTVFAAHDGANRDELLNKTNFEHKTGIPRGALSLRVNRVGANGDPPWLPGFKPLGKNVTAITTTHVPLPNQCAKLSPECSPSEKTTLSHSADNAPGNSLDCGAALCNCLVLGRSDGLINVYVRGTSRTAKSDLLDCATSTEQDWLRVLEFIPQAETDQTRPCITNLSVIPNASKAFPSAVSAIVLIGTDQGTLSLVSLLNLFSDSKLPAFSISHQTSSSQAGQVSVSAVWLSPYASATSFTKSNVILAKPGRQQTAGPSSEGDIQDSLQKKTSEGSNNLPEQPAKSPTVETSAAVLPTMSGIATWDNGAVLLIRYQYSLQAFNRGKLQKRQLWAPDPGLGIIFRISSRTIFSRVYASELSASPTPQLPTPSHDVWGENGINQKEAGLREVIFLLGTGGFVLLSLQPSPQIIYRSTNEHRASSLGTSVCFLSTSAPDLLELFVVQPEMRRTFKAGRSLGNSDGSATQTTGFYILQLHCDNSSCDWKVQTVRVQVPRGVANLAPNIQDIICITSRLISLLTMDDRCLFLSLPSSPYAPLLGPPRLSEPVAETRTVQLSQAQMGPIVDLKGSINRFLTVVTLHTSNGQPQLLLVLHNASSKSSESHGCDSVLLEEIRFHSLCEAWLANFKDVIKLEREVGPTNTLDVPWFEEKPESSSDEAKSRLSDHHSKQDTGQRTTITLQKNVQRPQSNSASEDNVLLTISGDLGRFEEFLLNQPDLLDLLVFAIVDSVFESSDWRAYQTRICDYIRRLHSVIAQGTSLGAWDMCRLLLMVDRTAIYWNLSLLEESLSMIPQTNLKDVQSGSSWCAQAICSQLTRVLDVIDVFIQHLGMQLNGNDEGQGPLLNDLRSTDRESAAYDFHQKISLLPLHTNSSLIGDQASACPICRLISDRTDETANCVCAEVVAGVSLGDTPSQLFVTSSTDTTKHRGVTPAWIIDMYWLSLLFIPNYRETHEFAVDQYQGSEYIMQRNFQRCQPGYIISLWHLFLDTAWEDGGCAGPILSLVLYKFLKALENTAISKCVPTNDSKTEVYPSPQLSHVTKSTLLRRILETCPPSPSGGSCLVLLRAQHHEKQSFPAAAAMYASGSIVRETSSLVASSTGPIYRQSDYTKPSFTIGNSKDKARVGSSERNEWLAPSVRVIRGFLAPFSAGAFIRPFIELVLNLIEKAIKAFLPRAEVNITHGYEFLQLTARAADVVFYALRTEVDETHQSEYISLFRQLLAAATTVLCLCARTRTEPPLENLFLALVHRTLKSTNLSTGSSFTCYASGNLHCECSDHADYEYQNWAQSFLNVIIAVMKVLIENRRSRAATAGTLQRVVAVVPVIESSGFHPHIWELASSSSLSAIGKLLLDYFPQTIPFLLEASGFPDEYSRMLRTVILLKGKGDSGERAWLPAPEALWPLWKRLNHIDEAVREKYILEFLHALYSSSDDRWNFFVRNCVGSPEFPGRLTLLNYIRDFIPSKRSIPPADEFVSETFEEVLRPNHRQKEVLLSGTECLEYYRMQLFEQLQRWKHVGIVMNDTTLPKRRNKIRSTPRSNEAQTPNSIIGEQTEGMEPEDNADITGYLSERPSLPIRNWPNLNAFFFSGNAQPIDTTTTLFPPVITFSHTAAVVPDTYSSNPLEYVHTLHDEGREQTDAWGAEALSIFLENTGPVRGGIDNTLPIRPATIT